ncbi:MAG: hypothetical protein ABI461_02670 [Polyangiaceae bacterium]
MRSFLNLVLVSAAVFALGATGCARGDGNDENTTPDKPTHTWPSEHDAGTSAHHDGGVDAGSGASAFESVDAGGTATSGGSGSGGSGSGGGSGGGSTTTGLNACGICDRDWQCDAARDTWVSDGTSACVDSRTGTTLSCDGTMLHGGTWSGDSTGLVLGFDSFGSTVNVYCTPPE